MVADTAKEPLLAVEDLSVGFRYGETVIEAVKHVSFHIAPGETLALVGESGSGKSVTAHSVLRLLPYPPAFHASGRILYRGTDLLTIPDDELRKVRGGRIGMIFQEPMTSLNPLHTVERQVGETLRIHQGLGDAEVRRRVIDLLQKVGISDAEHRLASFPHQLSGGQRQRVMIAMALANGPDLLIADEPTTAVDVTVQAQILNLLAGLSRELGMAMLFITHDLAVVRKFSNRVAIMQKGEIVEQGVTRDVFAAPQHAYTKMLLAAEPKIDPPPLRPDAEVVASVDDLKVWFPIKRGVLRRTVGYIKALDGVTLAVRRGETLGIVGESGSGKTTLGLAILRLIRSEGRIVVLGRDLTNRSWREIRPLRRDMQVVFQDPYGSLSPRMTVADIVAEGLDVHEPQLDRRARDQRAVAALTEVGIDPATRFRYPHEFSGGQRQRIAVARAMVLKPRFVVLDEPTSALDMSVQVQVVELLRSFQRTHDLTYLFISHDLKVIRALANEIVVLRNGLVVEHGTAADILERPQADYTRALIASALALEA
ncbi:MAG: ABC transporter ATP-binding protein [Bauldia sp.]|nr:ABC transporter ATP-binding protein [Bauldia sp.]